MQTTTNYGLRKPEYNETVDVADLNYNADQIDSALTPTADPALAYPDPMSNGPHKIDKWVSWIAKLIKSITGKTNWWEAPAKSLETVNSDLAAHLADEAPHPTATNIPHCTTGNMTLYVRTDGNDSNDGSTNDADHALLTIQAAINKIPQVVNHTVNIYVEAGTYGETIEVRGFVGKGLINIIGASTVANSPNYSINNALLYACLAPIYVQGFRCVSTTAEAAFDIRNCFMAQIYYCSSVVDATTKDGITIQNGKARIQGCEFSNRNRVIYAFNLGDVLSYAQQPGSGNGTGLRAEYGAKIAKYSTQPAGTTAEYTSTGGQIL